MYPPCIRGECSGGDCRSWPGPRRGRWTRCGAAAAALQLGWHWRRAPQPRCSTYRPPSSRMGRSRDRLVHAFKLLLAGTALGALVSTEAECAPKKRPKTGTDRQPAAVRKPGPALGAIEAALQPEIDLQRRGAHRVAPEGWREGVPRALGGLRREARLVGAAVQPTASIDVVHVQVPQKFEPGCREPATATVQGFCRRDLVGECPKA